MKNPHKTRENRFVVLQLIGANMRRIRLQQPGLTQAQVSLCLGTGQESYYRQLENGKKEMSLARLIEVADVLGCAPAELLKGI